MISLISPQKTPLAVGLIGFILEKYDYDEFIKCISCICGASMGIILFLPESLHWLILHGDRFQFQATMREAAAQNGTGPVDLEDLVPEPRSTHVTKDLSIWSPLLLRPTISLIFSWMFMSLIYYGKLL